MKTAKLVIGIFSIILFVIIAMQSCVAGLGNALADNGEVSGSAGLVVAVCMLVAGIVGICTRSGKSGGYVAGGIYAFGGLMGIANYGTYGDLQMWSIVSFLFAAVFILGGFFGKPQEPNA